MSKEKPKRETRKVEQQEKEISKKVKGNSKSEKKETKKKMQSAKKVQSETSSSYSSSSSSDTEEDENGALVTPAIDAQILHTIAEIRARDAKIYDPSKEFFDPEQLTEAQREWRERMAKKEKPIRLLDLQGREHQEEKVPVSFEEDQAKLKASFKFVDEDEGDFLRKKERSGEDAEKEEKEYCEFLLEQLSHNQHAAEAMQNWLEYRGEATQPTDENERFLMDYVLNRRWIEKEQKPLAVETPLSEDEKWIEGAEEWETKLNFRFEQAGGDQIISYPRQIDDSIRRTEGEGGRKKQREAKRERQREAKVREEEELKRKKQQKRAEIAKQIAELEAVSGLNDKRNLKTLLADDSDEFDPAEHDRRMQALFNDDYYQEQDDKMQADDNDDEEEETEMHEHGDHDDHDDDDNQVEKPQMEENPKVAALLNEYYGMDYEDKIDNVTCRFKYTSVPAASFGLTVKDILAADDADLNRHVSLKKLAPYRPVKEQERDIKRFGDKRRAYMFRKNLQTKQEATGSEKSKHKKRRIN